MTYRLFLVVALISFGLGYWSCWDSRVQAEIWAKRAKNDLLRTQDELAKVKAFLDAAKKQI